jgi:uncharacterized coiled-coil DUF342 family protein
MDEIEKIKKQMDMAQEMMVDSLKRISSDEEIFKYAARCYKSLFNNLKTEGFTEEQAMTIVMNYNPLK